MRKILLGQVRRGRGVTQKQLAEAVGVSLYTVSDWERGRLGRAAFEDVVAAARFLECTVWDLFRGDEED